MWEFLSRNELEDLFEKLIEKKLTKKDQVNELERLLEFLSRNELEDLFEKLIDKGFTTERGLFLINTKNVKKLDLEFGEENRLLSALEKMEEVFFYSILTFFFSQPISQLLKQLFC